MSTAHSGLTSVEPVLLVDRFPALHAELLTLLRGLSPAAWERPTACALWSVKDIVAHLLDTALRRLSYGRDALSAAPDRSIITHADLVAFLNHLNAEWVAVARRLSPKVLMDLLVLIEPQVHAYFRSLDPYAPAAFAVAWAGEEISPNWFDAGREYTERWLHQQQIREAVGAPGLTARAWLHPTLDIFVRALPFTYREIDAAHGSSIRLDIRGEAGGVWTLVRAKECWRLWVGADPTPNARVTLDQESAWKLFSKSLPLEEAGHRVMIDGDLRLGEPMLRALAVMA
jgi:uncharacterized protein (TIGR03083 family)